MAPNYKTNDPRGWNGNPAYGAALGRPTIQDADRAASVKLYLRRVHLDSGGYDSNGTYFGQGAPLFWCSDSEGDVDYMLRASDRESAKAAIRKTYTQAKFYR